MNLILKYSEHAIYGVQAMCGLYGLFLVILLIRMIWTKRFAKPQDGEDFLEKIREPLYRRDFEGVAAICDSPEYWNKTTAQLILVALANRDRGPAKVRQLVADKFERDVLSDMRHKHQWVATVTRAAPLLGLLGTVTSMVLAFASIGGASKDGIDPGKLASDLSLALQATMLGLWIAVPMTLFGSVIGVRIGRLTDSVQDQMGEFMHDLEIVMKGAPPASSTAA